jgi:hypothetical protein
MEHQQATAVHAEQTDVSVDEEGSTEICPQNALQTFDCSQKIKERACETKPHIRRILRKDEELSLDELGKRIGDINMNLTSKKSVCDDTDDFLEVCNKKLKKETLTPTAVDLFKRLSKTNQAAAIKPVELESKKGTRLFACFEDKTVFRPGDNKEFANLLMHHKQDNDFDTSSEDLQRGKKKAIHELNHALRFCRGISPIRLTDTHLDSRRKESTFSECGLDHAKSSPSSPSKQTLQTTAKTSRCKSLEKQ